jgi:hypothetical protein
MFRTSSCPSSGATTTAVELINLRNCCICLVDSVESMTMHVLVNLKRSLPHSRAPVTCLCPEPDQSIPCPPSHFLNICFYNILPSTTGFCKWFLSLRFPHHNPVFTSPLPHTCHMPRPSHSS